MNYHMLVNKILIKKKNHLNLNDHNSFRGKALDFKNTNCNCVSDIFFFLCIESLSIWQFNGLSVQIFLDAENGTWLTIGPTVITWFNELCSQSEPSLLNTAANIPRGRQAEKEEFQHSLKGQKHFQKTYEMMKKSCLLIGCQWSSCPVSRVHLVQ